MNDSVTINGFQIALHPDNEYISQELRTKGGYEQKYIKLISSFIRSGDTVLDIGANIGLHTLHFSRVTGKTGKVLAFEPDPINLELLDKNIRKNKCDNVVIYPIALGNSNYIGTLYRNKMNRGYQGFADYKNFNDPINIRVHKLSDIPEASSAAVIKMDVEGAEPAVFEGLGNISPPLIFF